MTPLPPRTGVVVVGAGPTGLALACTLRAAGIDVLVVDRATDSATTSRAAVVHARTLEVLDDLGVTPHLLAEGWTVPVFTVRDRDRVLARIDFAGLPSPHQYTLMLPQSRTEAVLAQRLTELGGQVNRPWAVTAVTVDGEGATVAVTGPNQEHRAVRARYVVGADGMHSIVREAAGIGFTGAPYAQSFLLADVRMDWPLPPREVQLFFSPAGLVVVAPLPGGLHRIVATVDQAPPHASSAVMQNLLDRRGPGGGRVHEVAWSSRFRVHHRVADAYRRGPLLLAGDAAHVHSPAGGQGMNLGIQDAVDLGRSLQQTLLYSPTSSPLLDRYEARRRPLAQDVVTLTDRLTRAATLTHPVTRTARNTAIGLLGRVPAARHRLALQLAGLSTRTEKR